MQRMFQIQNVGKKKIQGSLEIVFIAAIMKR